MGGQVGESEAGLVPVVPVEQFEGPEVREQQVARPVALRKRVEIAVGLGAGGGEIAPGALLLD